MKLFKALVLALTFVLTLTSFSMLFSAQAQQPNRGKIVLESTGQVHHVTYPDGASHSWCDGPDETECIITIGG